MLWLCVWYVPQLYTDYWRGFRSEKSLTFMQKFSCNRKKRELKRGCGLLHIKGNTAVWALLFLLSFPKDCKSSLCGNFVSMPILICHYLPCLKSLRCCGLSRVTKKLQYSKQRKKSCIAFGKYEHFECFRALMTP